MPLPHTTRITKTNTTLSFSFLFSVFFSATFSSPFVFFISPYFPPHTHTSSHFVFFQVSTPLSLTLCFTCCMFNPVPTLQQSDFCESQFPSHNEASPHGSSRIKTHFGTTIWGSFFIVVLISDSMILIENQDVIHFGSIHCSREMRFSSRTEDCR